jgi:hypothetical protein
MIFTRLMKPVAGFLRKRGVRLIIYLDDILIIGPSAQEATRSTIMAMALLESLGFTLNRAKSILTPTPTIQFLGFSIDSTTMRVSLPSEKITKLHKLCRQLGSTTKPKLRSIAQLLGLLESYRPAIWKAPLHFRYLQALLIRGLLNSNHNYEAEVCLSNKQTLEIQWWLQNITSVNGSPIVTPPPDITIFSDASKKGWGAVCNNHQTNGKWSATERLLHINILELKAAFLGLKFLLRNHRSMTVSLNMDNSTAVAYVNHKGGTHSTPLLEVTLEL